MSRWQKTVLFILFVFLCVIGVCANAEPEIPNPECSVPASLRAGEPLVISSSMWLPEDEYSDQYYSFWLGDQNGQWICSNTLWYENRPYAEIKILPDEGLDAGTYQLTVVFHATSIADGSRYSGEEKNYVISVAGSRPAAPAVSVILDGQPETERNQVKVSSPGLTAILVQKKDPNSTGWSNAKYEVSAVIQDGEATCRIRYNSSPYYKKSRSAVYRMRTMTGGCWSELSDPVTLTWTVLGTLDTPSVEMPGTARAGEPIAIHVNNSDPNQEYYYYIREKLDEETGSYGSSTGRNMIYASSDSFDYTLHEYGLDAGTYKYSFFAWGKNYEDSEAAVCILTVSGERPETPSLRLSTNRIYKGEAVTVTIQGNRKLEEVKDLHSYPSRLYAAFNGRVIITTRELNYPNYFSFRAKVDGCWTEEFRSEEIEIIEDESQYFRDIVVDFEGLTAYAGRDFTFPVELDPRTKFFTVGIVYCEMDETGYDHDLREIVYEMVLDASDGRATIPGDLLKFPGTYRINFNAYADDLNFGSYTDGYFLEVVDSSPSAAAVTVSSEDISNLETNGELQITVTAPGASAAALKVHRMDREDSIGFEIDGFCDDIAVTDGKATLPISFDDPYVYSVSAMAVVNGHWTGWSEPLILRLTDLEEGGEEKPPLINITSCPDTVIIGEPFTISWDPIEGAEEYDVEYFCGKSISGFVTVPAPGHSLTLTINATEEEKLLVNLLKDNPGSGISVLAEANGVLYCSNAKSFELIDSISPTLTAEKTQVGKGGKIKFTVSGMRANDLRIRINGVPKGQMSFETVNNEGTIILAFPDEGDYRIEAAVRHRIHPYSNSIWSGWSAPVDVQVGGYGSATTIILPADTKTVESEAFAGTDCVYAVINDHCTTIEDRAFADCISLLEVRIPESVKTINGNPFEGCGEDLVIITPSGSTADLFAESHGILTERE